LYLKAGRLTLLALDMHGWSSLCKLSSALLTDPAFENNPVLPFERLSEFTGGVLCLAGLAKPRRCLQRDNHEQALTEALGQLADIYPDRFYLGIEDPALMPLPLESARSLNLPLVAAPSVYYLDPGETHLQQVVTAVRLNCRLDQVPEEEQAPPGASFLPPDEMAKRYAEFPGAGCHPKLLNAAS
jgi:DNA polymerase III alpha subunit